MISDDAVTAAKIANNTINSSNISDNAVGSTKIASNSILTRHIDDDQITTDQIAELTIATINIAHNSINANKIATGIVDATHIADNTITNAEIAANAVGSSKIASNSILTRHIDDDQITTDQIAANTIATGNIADNAIDSTKIAGNAVAASEITANAVGSSEIANNSITSTQLASDALGGKTMTGTITFGDDAVINLQDQTKFRANGSLGINDNNAPQRLHLNGVAGMDVGTGTSSATTEFTLDSFASATFRTAKYLVQVKNSTDSDFHCIEILLFHDGSTVYLTQYASIFDNGAQATFDADINSGNVRLRVTPASGDTMAYKYIRTTIEV